MLVKFTTVFIFRSLKDPIDVDLVPVFEFMPSALSGFHVIYEVLSDKEWVNVTKFNTFVIYKTCVHI
jgi:hypothetical protein